MSANRSMKLGTLLTGTLLLFGTVSRQVCSQETIEHAFDLSGERNLEISIPSGGSIDIRGWDEMHAEARVRFRNTDPDAFRFEFDQRGQDLIIRSERLRRLEQVDLAIEVRVPRAFNLDLRTGGGGITLADIEGRIEGRTGGGELDLRHLRGSIRLTTGGGEITVLDSELDGRVSTGGGAVLVENVRGDFRATSGGGEVVYRNVVTPDRTYPGEVVNIRNAGGSIEVEDAPAGADLSTGGGEIHVRSAGSWLKARTGGGDISIGTVDGWIETSTGGGEITIDEVTGRVEASTGAGEIRVTMTGDPDEGERGVDLRSGYGDIYLTLPEGLSMTVEIELSYTRDARGTYQIRSDWDLREERTETWDTSQGSPRKYIYGRAGFGDGRNVIRIRTCNGNVYLRKGR
jgi:hypothetical protein